MITTGRYMVATRNISALEVILSEVAAAVGPKLEHDPVCVECLAELDTRHQLISCPLCGLPFCSVKCRDSRRLHSAECSVLASCQPPLTREDLHRDSGVLASVTAVRLLKLRDKDPDLFQRVDMLMDNVDKLRESSDWARQEKCVEFLSKRCGDKSLTGGDVHRALGIFASNSCSLASYRGRGLFPTFSLINHSCVRNARHIVTSDQRLMEVVAQRDIRAGEEINVRYTSGWLELDRREQIRSQWYFDCDCVRCSDPTDCQTFSSAIVCAKCRHGLVLPQSGDLWRCEDCQQQYLPAHIDKVISKLKILLDKTPRKDPEKLENFLKIATKFVHSNHCLLIDVKKSLLALYGSPLSPSLISRKLELAEEILAVQDKLDPGMTTWRGQILYDVTRFRLMLALQGAQAGQISTGDCITRLEEAAGALETAVGSITGERVGEKGRSLRQRLTSLAKAQILGDGYKMLLQASLKMPFIK